MDARRLIRKAVEDENYFLGGHCLEEMDKDGLSPEQIETVMIKGSVRKRNVRLGRYTLSYGDIMISVETRPDSESVVIVTAGRVKGR